ncbi:MAG: hypothetical protein C0604_00960, partial [Clostridiales bacterium]
EFYRIREKSSAEENAGALASFLGIDSEKALDVTDKKRMKTIMSEGGVPTLPYAFIGVGFKKTEISHLKAPYVIKPLDSQWHRGVFRLDTEEEI